MSSSSEHQEFFTFLQRVVSPVLEAYSGAAIFVHGLLAPMAEREYTQRLFKYLLTRTEKGLAAYGQSPLVWIHVVVQAVKSLDSFESIPQRLQKV